MVNRLTFNARSFFWGWVIWGLSMHAWAFIDVTPKFVDIEASSLSVVVSNKGDVPEYVQVELSRIENPGVSPDEERLVPIGLMSKPDMYASPFKLTLGPRQEKNITIQVLHQPLIEQVYRLSVMPQRNIALKNSHSPVVNVGLGYLVLIRQQPEKKDKSWTYQCLDNGIMVTATGTVHLLFSELKLDVQTVDNFNLYPGTPRLMQGKLLVGFADGKAMHVMCN